MSEHSDKTADPTPTPSANANGKERRDRRERDFVRECVDANTRIAVRVQRTKAFRPYYSLVVGRFVQHDAGETFVPYIPVRAETEHAKVKSVQDHSKLIAALVKEATDWITEQLQAREDEIIEKQQENESRRLDRDKPGTPRPGLKQLGKIDRITKTFA